MGGEEKERIQVNAGKVVDINRMTKNPNPDDFSFCVKCDILYQHNTHCFKCLSRNSIGLPSYVWLAQEQP